MVRQCVFPIIITRSPIKTRRSHSRSGWQITCNEKSNEPEARGRQITCNEESNESAANISENRQLNDISESKRMRRELEEVDEMVAAGPCDRHVNTSPRQTRNTPSPHSRSGRQITCNKESNQPKAIVNISVNRQLNNSSHIRSGRPRQITCNDESNEPEARERQITCNDESNQPEANVNITENRQLNKISECERMRRELEDVDNMVAAGPCDRHVDTSPRQTRNTPSPHNRSGRQITCNEESNEPEARERQITCNEESNEPEANVNITENRQLNNISECERMRRKLPEVDEMVAAGPCGRLVNTSPRQTRNTPSPHSRSGRQTTCNEESNKPKAIVHISINRQLNNSSHSQSGRPRQITCNEESNESEANISENRQLNDISESKRMRRELPEVDEMVAAGPCDRHVNTSPRQKRNTPSPHNRSGRHITCNEESNEPEANVNITENCQLNNISECESMRRKLAEVDKMVAASPCDRHVNTSPRQTRNTPSPHSRSARQITCYEESNEPEANVHITENRKLNNISESERMRRGLLHFDIKNPCPTTPSPHSRSGRHITCNEESNQLEANVNKSRNPQLNNSESMRREFAEFDKMVTAGRSDRHVDKNPEETFNDSSPSIASEEGQFSALDDYNAAVKHSFLHADPRKVHKYFVDASNENIICPTITNTSNLFSRPKSSENSEEPCLAEDHKLRKHLSHRITSPEKQVETIENSCRTPQKKTPQRNATNAQPSCQNTPNSANVRRRGPCPSPLLEYDQFHQQVRKRRKGASTPPEAFRSARKLPCHLSLLQPSTPKKAGALNNIADPCTPIGTPNLLNKKIRICSQTPTSSGTKRNQGAKLTEQDNLFAAAQSKISPNVSNLSKIDCAFDDTPPSQSSYTPPPHHNTPKSASRRVISCQSTSSEYEQFDQTKKRRLSPMQSPKKAIADPLSHSPLLCPPPRPTSRCLSQTAPLNFAGRSVRPPNGPQCGWSRGHSRGLSHTPPSEPSCGSPGGPSKGGSKDQIKPFSMSNKVLQTRKKLSPAEERKAKKKHSLELTDEQKALVLDNYYPGLLHDAVNQNADFNEVAKRFITPDSAIDGDKTEKGMSLLEAFDTRVKVEQFTFRNLINVQLDNKSKDPAPVYVPVYGPAAHPTVSDMAIEEHVRAAASPVDLQQYLRTQPESDPVRAIFCLTRAQKLNDFYKEYRGAQIAASQAPPEQVEMAALHGAKSFHLANLKSESQSVDSNFFKPLELISYIGITKPN